MIHLVQDMAQAMGLPCQNEENALELFSIEQSFALKKYYRRRSNIFTLFHLRIAQLVEQRTENPCVGGSIPPLGDHTL